MTAPARRFAASVPSSSSGDFTSDSSLQVGDLIVAMVYVRNTTVTPSASVNSPWVQLSNDPNNDGSTDGGMFIAYLVVTSGGAQSYTPFALTGASSVSVAYVALETGTYDKDNIVVGALGGSGTSAGNDVGAITGLNSAKDYRLIAFGAWHTNSVTTTLTVPTSSNGTYGNQVDRSGSANNECASCDLTVSGVTSDDPGTWADNQVENHSMSRIIGVPGAVPATERTAAVAGTGAVATTFVPFKVTGLVTTPVSDTEIDLEWDEEIYQGGGYAYDIERNGTVIVRDHPTNSYSDTGLDPDTEYDYRVRAVRGA